MAKVQSVWELKYFHIMQETYIIADLSDSYKIINRGLHKEIHQIIDVQVFKKSLNNRNVQSICKWSNLSNLAALQFLAALLSTLNSVVTLSWQKQMFLAVNEKIC